jgi:hypothetical protein
METIITFFENNKDELLNYNKTKIDKLYELIKNNAFENMWSKNAKLLLNNFYNNFDWNNTNQILYFTIQFNKCIYNYAQKIKIEIEIINKNFFIYRKIILCIQLLEFIKINNKHKLVIYDKEKHKLNLLINEVFCTLSNNLYELYTVWISNTIILFYSKNNNFINICFYEYDEIFDYKLFLTYKYNLSNNKKNILICNSVIYNSDVFYTKLNFLNEENYKHICIIDYINDIAQCFDNQNIALIKFIETTNIDKYKMLEYVKYFLDNNI